MNVKLKQYLKRNFVITIIVLIGGYIYITPYLSIIRFKLAIDSNNPIEAREYIDFPSVRDSLKPQIKLAFVEMFSNNTKLINYSPLGLFFMEPLLDSIVDNTVTPRGLRALLNQGLLSKTKKTRRSIEIKDKINIDQQQLSISQVNNNKSKISMYYRDMNTFVLNSKIALTTEPILFYMKRYGLFNWKLNSLSIPSKIIDFTF